ncbi:MAG: PIG-L deacetylase family protein [Bacteroidota bacterium]
MEYKKVLVLAPHTDDEMGCGGTIIRMIENKAEVYVAAFSTAVESLPVDLPKDTLKKEFLEALPTLGVPRENLFVYDYPVRRLSNFRQEILEELVRLRRQIQPDLILLPSGNDLHQDHQVIFSEGLRAYKDISVLGYELPWNHITFSAQAFIVIQKHHLDLKWKALQTYQSQFELRRYYFSREFIESIARVRGTQVKEEFAEAYEVLRIKF